MSCDCAVAVANCTAAVASLLSVNAAKSVFGASVIKSEVMLTSVVLSAVFHSWKFMKQVGDSSESKNPSLSSSISIKSLNPSPSVSVQFMIVAFTA